MKLPRGFHKDVIESKVSIENIDFSKTSLKKHVSTSPLVTGGTNFKTHVLKTNFRSKISYRPSLGGLLFLSLFVVIGMALVIYNLIDYNGLFTAPSLANILTLAIGLLFAFVGGYMSYKLSMPRVFDKQLGYYYKAYSFQLDDRDLKKYIALNSIVAIQIIGETVKSKDRSFGSFELNLVLNDSTRENVIDHGNLKSIINDAYIISEFLNTPIWHAETRKE